MTIGYQECKKYSKIEFFNKIVILSSVSMLRN